MVKKNIKIGLTSGFEARPVAILVQIASQYDSQIYLESANTRVNAKSIMGMMALGMANGDDITVTANGEDEEAAIQGIEDYLQNK